MVRYGLFEKNPVSRDEENDSNWTLVDKNEAAVRAASSWGSSDDSCSPDSDDEKRLHGRPPIMPPGPFMFAYTPKGEPVVVPYDDVDHGSSQPQRGRRLSIVLMWLALLGFLIAHAVARYGPPAPPPSQSSDESLSSSESHPTWEQFLSTHGKQLWNAATALFSIIPYVGGWCWRGFYEEIVEMLRPPPCPLVPNLANTPDNNPQGWLGERIVGQERALRLVAETIQSWDGNDENKSPLTMLFSGTVGVGKTELARVVTESFFSHCNEQTDNVLFLDPTKPTDGLEADPVSLVQQHVQRRPAGSAIIIHHAENLPSGSLTRICQTLRREKVVLIATTHLGSRVIHRFIKEHGTERMPRLELDLTLRHEMDTRLESDVAQYFQSVIPFMPLGRDETQTVLLANAPQWMARDYQASLGDARRRKTSAVLPTFRMTLELARTWTDETHVEYIQWKSSDRTVLVLASRGAMDIVGVIRQQLQLQLRTCFGKSNHGEEPSHESSSLFELDWDDSSDQAILHRCEQDNDDEELVVCEDICRFYLD